MSIIDKNDGLFNPALRFAFTNITVEDFVSAWNGEPIIVKPGQTVELPHHLAVKLTNELIDKIMIEDIKLDEVANAGNIPYYRAPKGTSLGVPAARKVYEDQIVRQLDTDEESPEMQIIRAQIKEELMADISMEKSTAPVPVPSSFEEFAEIKKEVPRTAPRRGRPMKLKELK